MQSWWDRHIVSRMVRCGCSQAMLCELRNHVIPLAEGRVLDIGVGAGANFALYDQHKVTGVTGVDPSPELLKSAAEEGKRIRIPCELHQASGEDLPFDDNSFDTVVTTFTLCSVTDPERVLAEVQRVLKPAGKFLFLEHSRCPEDSLQRWQYRIEPIWKKLTGNCHLTRPAIANVAKSGLTLLEDHGFFAQGKRSFIGWMEWGVARKH
ncbi:MAG TPA: class I SAM-dependent methyltransferase [Spongiibacteraceae bacterium]|nr:class I SAM-dependent methyltransferase [Spongiibacteraceae bacterium]